MWELKCQLNVKRLKDASSHESSPRFGANLSRLISSYEIPKRWISSSCVTDLTKIMFKFLPTAYLTSWAATNKHQFRLSRLTSGPFSVLIPVWGPFSLPEVFRMMRINDSATTLHDEVRLLVGVQYFAIMNFFPVLQANTYCTIALVDMSTKWFIKASKLKVRVCSQY